MLKVCTSYSKKIPADEQYSSKQFHASVEIELSDALSPEQLQDRIHQTFALVKNTVENEINGKAATPAATRTSPEKKNGDGSKASNAQIKYMTSLATEQDIRLSALNAYAKDNYNVDSIYELTKKDASALVDALKHSRIKAPVV
jgi:hypothetical protein